MTLPRVTVDANLLASGAVRSRLDAAPVRLVDAWQARRFSLILSDHLLGEVERALAKPYFVQRLSLDERRDFLTLLRTDGVITPLTVAVTGIATHPEDDVVLATALSGNAEFVGTGDHKHLTLKSYQDVLLVSVHEFLATLPGLTTAVGEEP